MAQRRFIPSNQTRGLRQVQSGVLTADNQQVTLDLPRGPHLEGAILRVGGTINNTVAFTAVRNLAPYQYLRNVQWVINSNVTLDSVSGTQLFQSYFTRRNFPPSTSPAAAGVGAQSFAATFALDRVIMDMMRPKDSILKTDVGMANNQLRIQFGALADMYTGAGTATYTAVTWSVFVQDYQEAPTAGGDTPAPTWYAKRTGTRITLPSAGAGQLIKLNTGNRLRAISVRALNSTTGEPDINLISRLGLIRAGDTRVDMAVPDLLVKNAMDYGVAPSAGQAIIDLANPGSLGVRYSEFWPIPSSADTFLRVDTTGATILDYLVLEGVDLVRP